MELFNNTLNDYLKFKLNSEGINEENIEARLILTTKENKNYFIKGDVNKGVCRFDIPELELYEKGQQGEIKFEIISEDMYFPVWCDTFEIKSKSFIKIEEMISEMKTESKPKISVSIDREQKEQESKIKPKVETKNESKVKEDKIEIKNEQVKTEKNETTPNIPSLKKFSEFYK